MYRGTSHVHERRSHVQGSALLSSAHMSYQFRGAVNYEISYCMSETMYLRRCASLLSAQG
jgi:hypothetical protein